MLAQCIRALVTQRRKETKSKKKPKKFSFRAYMFDLIQLLSESMTGRALTAVIVCVSQAPANASQSAFALDFGSTFAQLQLRGSVKKLLSIEALVKAAEKQRNEAEHALASNVSAKWVNVRKAQLLDANQLLGVLDRLGADCGKSKSSGGDGGKKKEKFSK